MARQSRSSRRSLLHKNEKSLHLVSPWAAHNARAGRPAELCSGRSNDSRDSCGFGVGSGHVRSNCARIFRSQWSLVEQHRFSYDCVSWRLLRVHQAAPVGVPVGIELLGPDWSEPVLIKLAYAFEQFAKIRKPPASTPPLSR